MATATSIPPQPAAASQAALDAAIKENGDSSASADAATGDESAATDADDSVRTVFDDKEDFNAKHPLYNTWTLWFDNPSHKSATSKGSKDSWGEDLNKVVTFDSVEEFWGLYNNVVPPSELPQKANYYLFKEGIKPAWEDPANANGGKWSIQLPRDKSRASIDRLWLYTMLSAIGETLDVSNTTYTATEDQLITGVIMSARANFYRIAIWTRKSDDPSSVGGDASAVQPMVDRLVEMGKKFKVEVLGFGIDQKLGSGLMSDVEFQSHTESEKKKGRKIVL